MNRKFKILVMALAVGALFVNYSCTQSDDYSTDQMTSDDVVLRVYGPRPAMRGAEMRFVGANMDRVTGVVFPVAGEVSSFVSQSKSEVRVVVPVDAGYGKLVLKTTKGDVEVESTMTYTEPIKVTALTQGAVKAGDVVEIKGEFLYLVNSVHFQGGTIVNLTEANKTFSAEDPSGTQTIKVTLPVTAQSGMVTLSTATYDDEGNEIGGIPTMVNSGSLLLTVVEPKVTSFSPAVVKAGAVLTINGTDLDLVEAIAFVGAAPVTNFTVSGGTKITVTVPAIAQDGPVTLVAKSGAENASAADAEMVVPTGMAVTAESRFKAGLNVVISGTDLDLVTALTFTGVGETSAFTYAEGKITVAIPATATDGVVTLDMASGKSVETSALTLVVPTIASFAPAGLMVGDNVTVTGTDLDLVVSATIGGSAVIVDTESQSETEVVLTTFLSTPSGKIALTTANGTTVTSEDELLVTSLLPAVTTMPDMAQAGDELTLVGKNFKYVEATWFGDVKVTDYISRTDGELVLTIPEGTPSGTYKIKFVTIDGDEVFTDSEITLIVIGWEGVIDQNATQWNGTGIPLAGFVGIEPGATLYLFFRDINLSAGPQMQVFFGDWGSGPPTYYPTTESDVLFSFVADEDTTNHMLNPAWGSDALLFQGQGCVLYRVAYANPR